MADPIIVSGLSNREFFEAHAQPGRIGLIGGTELSNKLIRRAQRHLDDENAWSNWSHAFIFQGRRADGHHWLIESDLAIQRKHIRLGVQENRVIKYAHDQHYNTLAVLDLGLTAEQTQRLLANALELVAAGTRYSLREIIGTAWALRHPSWQPKDNLLAQEKAFYCSAFVRHVFSATGIELVDGIAEKNTAPEHIARTAVPHTQWLMIRQAPPSPLKRVVRRLRARVRRRLG